MSDEFGGTENLIATPPAVCDALRTELDAAVAESASLAWTEAGASCYNDPAAGESCMAYHRGWQYLLLLGIRDSTHADTQFLLDTFRLFARRGDRRVLISGAADYAMLAHVLRAFELEQATADVTVLDRCQTPLTINRWYADRKGVSIETAQDDATKFVAASPFDILCTHSFLGWFSPEKRDRLLATWAGNLRPGGHVVTTRRIRQATSRNGRHVYDAAELKYFEKKVRSAAEAMRDRLEIEPEEIVGVAVEDARTRARYTTTSQEELVALFARHGFEVIVADDGGSPAPTSDHLPSGPIRGAGKRIRIVARAGDSI